MPSLTSIFWFCCASAASLCVLFGATIPELAKAARPTANDDLFAGTNVVRIRIEIPRSGMATLRRTGWGNGQERPWVKATVREGNAVYTDVAVHMKGSAGSFRSVDDNPCLTLNFEKLAPGQSFHGLHKFSLNNSVQDRSFLTEKICRELFDVAGVPVPRAAFARVELNGRDLGLRVLVEGANKQFLKRCFTNTRGNLYDGGFVQDITAPLAVNSGDNPEDHSGLRALIAAAREPDPTRRFAQLEQALDMDRFLSYLAMDVIQCDWDGYAMNRNNWRIFHDLDANKMVFIPHGLDQMFGVQRTTPNLPILPPMQGMVARAVVATREGRRRYLERVSQLYTNVLHVEAILKRVDELASVIRPVIAESNPQAARHHDQEVQWLRQRITRRDESLKNQLMNQLMIVTSPREFHAGGVMRLTGWKPGTQAGKPSFGDDHGSQGNAPLYIAASDANTVGSWRTRVMLDSGNYRFGGRIRTKDVRPRSGEPDKGAGLRISRGTIPKGLSGSTEWRSFACSFQVPEGGADVEFVCELRASEGEAWFDRASLRVIRER